MPPKLHVVLLLVVTASFPGGCSKQRGDLGTASPAPEEATPHPFPKAAESPLPPPSPAPTSTPEPTPAPPNALPGTPEEAPANPAQLQASYLAARELAERIELVYQLGNADSADALLVLTRLFQSETDPHLKQEMLDAADRIDGQLPAMLSLLGVALGASQPADVRDEALAMLLGINDRRAIPIWQPLLTDADPDTRELAKQQIEDLQLLLPD